MKFKLGPSLLGGGVKREGEESTDPELAHAHKKHKHKHKDETRRNAPNASACVS